MIYKPVYAPKARAREYGDLAINIYSGCNHGCDYCYARDMKKRFTPKHKTCTFDSPEPRPGIVESVKRQIEREGITGKLIHLCFLCDPYPAEIDTTPTQEIIKIIKGSGNHVQILTKGGERAERDFYLLDSNDWFGVTYTTDTGDKPDKREPNAAPAYERLDTLRLAYWRKINTWVSCEPVIDPAAVYALIEQVEFINLFRIGKMNHRPSGIDWAEFGANCSLLCKVYERELYIKEDLRAEMAKSGKIDYSSCPYWSGTGCTGFNCCTEEYCPYARESQPILFERREGCKP